MQLLLQPASRGMLTFSTNKFISHFPVIRFAQKLGSRSIALGAMYMQSFERKGCELHPQQPELKGPVQLKGPVFDCIDIIVKFLAVDTSVILKNRLCFPRGRASDS